MTANRWWVKAYARWIAKVDGVSQQLRLGFLAMTGNGIMLNTLSRYGLGQYAAEFLTVSVILTILYTHLYNEGGVRNQVGRDRQDLGTNYAGPTMRMDDELIARGVLAGEKGEQLSDKERNAIKGELDEAFIEYRDGIPEELLK